MAENLIQNGSFEETIDIGDDGFEPLQAGQNAIDGWEIIANPEAPPVDANTVYDIDIIGEVEGSTQFWGGSDGLQSLDLHGSPGYGGVEQTIDTTIGQRYTITFDMAGNPQSPEGLKVKEMKVQVIREGLEETEIFSFDTTNNSVENMGWEQKTLDFTATSEETTLRFLTEVNEAEGINLDPLRGPALDNVVVMPILEFVEVEGTGEDDVLVGRDENIIAPPDDPDEDEDDVDEDEQTPDEDDPDIDLLPTNYAMSGESGDDFLIGQDGNDSLDGGGNDDILTGKQGNDTLEGGNGDDNLFGGLNDDSLNGGGGDDVLRGGRDFDTLDGGNGDDILIGGAGQDVLVGGDGVDVLIGGNSPDAFRYNNVSEGGDIIVDFAANLETIEVSAEGFGGDLFPDQVISEEQFVIGSEATDAAHRFIYDDVTGSLYFDADGSGAAQQVLIADFGRVDGDFPLLTNENIVVIM